MAERVLIVGAGLAGSRCAQTLRAEGFEGEITLVGESDFANRTMQRRLVTHFFPRNVLSLSE